MDDRELEIGAEASDFIDSSITRNEKTGGEKEEEEEEEREAIELNNMQEVSGEPAAENVTQPPAPPAAIAPPIPDVNG